MFDKISAWFNNDYNPLDGRLRFIFYFLLLLIGYKYLFIRVPEQVFQCPQELYHPGGLFALVFGDMHSVSFMHALLIDLKYPFLIFWVFSIIGFGGRLSLFCNAVCLFVFWGAHVASSGTGHFWHVPLLIFGVFAFTLTHDKYSIDFFLNKRIKWYPFKNNQTDLSAFGRKLILIALVQSLFSAGVSKLSMGGLTWMNGHTLHYYLENINSPRYYIGPILLKFLLANFWLVSILSILTILFELSSLSILFLPRYRILFVIQALFFHTFILLLMPPVYFPQMICYLLIINWQGVLEILNRKQKYGLKKLLFGLPSRNTKTVLSPLQQFVTITTGLLFILTLVCITVFRTEYFPLTNYPMYSSSVNEDKMSGIPLSEFNSYEGLKRLAMYCSDHEAPDLLPHYLSKNKRCSAIKVNRNTLKKSDYNSNILKGIPTTTLWYTQLSHAMLSDLRSAPLSYPSEENNFPKTQKLFNAVIKKSLQQNDAETRNCDFFLVYTFSKDNQIILAKYKGN